MLTLYLYYTYTKLILYSYYAYTMHTFSDQLINCMIGNKIFLSRKIT